MKASSCDQVYEINNKKLCNEIFPYINDLIKIIETKGTVLGKNNSYVEGYKITRDQLNFKNSKIFSIIEKSIKNIEKDSSAIIGTKLKIADCSSEKYCWFLRLYNKSGHYLDMHFDNNFTKGKRYTYVLNLYTSECNSSHFISKSKNKMNIFRSNTGNGVVYNGSSVKHAISTQTTNCTRISLIIPLYENYKLSILGSIRAHARNITYKLLGL